MDTPELCEVTDELWDYITGSDPANEHNYYGVRCFKAGTSHDLLKKKNMTTSQVMMHEDRKHDKFSDEQAIDLMQTKIDYLKSQQAQKK
jgi:hypothetical protein